MEQHEKGENGEVNFDDIEDFTDGINKVKAHRARTKSFREFIRAIPKLIAIVFAVGMALAVSGEWLAESQIRSDRASQHDPAVSGEGTAGSEHSGFFLKLLSSLLKDAGMALSVSAIAAFGFEQIKQARGEFDQRELTEGMFRSLDKARRELRETKSLSTIIKQQDQHLQDTLKITQLYAKRIDDLMADLIIVKTEDLYEQCLTALPTIFPAEVDGKALQGGEALSKSIKQLIETAHTLQGAPDKNRPDIQQYLSFLGWLIEKVPHPYATAFSLFVRHEQSNPEVRDVPSTHSIASEFLSSYMNLLQAGDEYLAVSNILSWDAGEWQSFRAAIEAACTRGVKTRRLFNLCSYIDKWKNRNEKKPDGLTDAEEAEARRKVATHYALQKAALQHYEIRFFGPDEINEVTTKFNEKTQLLTMTCGIFSYNYNGVRKNKVVKAADESVSTLNFDHNSKDYEMFEKIWKGALQKNPFEAPEFQYGQKP